MKSPNFSKKSKKHIDKSIAITGHMGSGKTLLGKLIAKEINYRFFDSDKLIKKNTQKSIKNIFLNEGEAEFRKIEEKTIINLKNETKIVLSLGGGAILSSRTRKLLKTHFITVFLDIDFEILQQRLKKSYKRPLLINENILQQLKKLDNIRRKYYLLADIKINSYESPANIVSIFLKEFNQLNEKNN
ncbi:shikimate kinase [Alphaproteobacteria bacterium]|nr:shikimate kinase [Alphaproteobacteria bacterium]